MDLRRPTRLFASLLIVALVVAAGIPALAASAADAGPGWGVIAWMQQTWARLADRFGAWTGANADPFDAGGAGGFTRITAPNGEEMDPDGTPKATSVATSDPLGATAPKGDEPDA